MKAVNIVLALLLFMASAHGAQILSPFAGRKTVGAYETDFVKFYYLVEKKGGVETALREGRLSSRIYSKPASKSNYEVFRSYEKELAAAGFKMLAVLDDASKAELLARRANSKGKNNFQQRAYTHAGKPVSITVKAKMASQGQEYIAAHKTADGKEIVMVVITSRSGDYVVEQFETAAMEEDTVTLTLDALRDRLVSEGRIAIYGLHFDTGSAQLKPASAETVATIVEYLRGHPQQVFYVVGHTDDQGALASNMSLSAARAKSVVAAVTRALPGRKNSSLPAASVRCRPLRRTAQQAAAN